MRLQECRALAEGQALTLEIEGRRHELVLPLVGSFQSLNALCAMGLVMAGRPESGAAIVSLLAGLKGAPGRLELVPGHPAGAAVYVDYAHTPDALDNILDALRIHTEGRLICIAGCGGDRDPGKRPIMGRIAAEKADLAVITDDNPRTEDPVAIRAEMMRDAPGAREIAGRREAIRWAVGQLQRGDVLVIAGKGHEQGQIVGEETLPFDDAAEARQAMILQEKDSL